MIEIEESYFEKKGVKGLDHNKVYHFVAATSQQKQLGTKYKRKQRIKVEDTSSSSSSSSSSCLDSTKRVPLKPIDEMKEHIRSILLPRSLSEVPLASSSYSLSSSPSSKPNLPKEVEIEKDTMNNDNSSQDTSSSLAQDKGKEKVTFLQEEEEEEKNHETFLPEIQVVTERTHFQDIHYNYYEVEEEYLSSLDEDRIFDEVFDQKEEQLVEYWESKVGNQKKGHIFVRSSQKNKKEKVNYERYVNARDKKRKEELTSYLSLHYMDVKANRSIQVAKDISLINSGRPSRSNTNNNSSRNTNSNNGNQKSNKSKNPLGLPDDVFQALEKLQWKTDITPEDYDLLLRLDDTVKPKTISPHKLRSVPETKPTEEDLATGKLCTVCLEPYNCSHLKKTLPCGHDFHSKCIDYWLMNSSQNCPLDGLPAFV